ncbi:uncharacterized protein K452DRAFT_290002 [Aplosporella prunicola CBS 121167]|uniref:Uncharacterized protein n=1 Tax=Aplosporella prunicola CBS 121167 TaxID=1176127 RepID=A0A6A6B6F6_9PEZI|nr:uncharacterized protein K452DRAFT_290002 [Aplosporella prunicola CBS 121167]KAF2139446.1 hypothetical protein K452DRAFT_290002 [Aplosporella prunicola CBS 121167]
MESRYTAPATPPKRRTRATVPATGPPTACRRAAAAAAAAENAKRRQILPRPVVRLGNPQPPTHPPRQHPHPEIRAYQHTCAAARSCVQCRRA